MATRRACFQSVEHALGTTAITILTQVENGRAMPVGLGWDHPHDAFQKPPLAKLLAVATFAGEHQTRLVDRHGQEGGNGQDKQHAVEKTAVVMSRVRLSTPFARPKLADDGPFPVRQIPSRQGRLCERRP